VQCVEVNNAVYPHHFLLVNNLAPEYCNQAEFPGKQQYFVPDSPCFTDSSHRKVDYPACVVLSRLTLFVKKLMIDGLTIRQSYQGHYWPGSPERVFIHHD